MKIISVVGARPNFMKIALIIRAIDKFNRESQITGLLDYPTTRLLDVSR